MKITCELNGLDQLQGNIERTIVRVRREAKKVALAEAESIMADSIAQVPVDTYALKESAFIEQDSDGEVTFGYGKANVQVNPKSGQLTDEYMMAVHERLDVEHVHGKAKFLEDPINAHKATMEVKIASKLRRLLGLGG